MDETVLLPLGDDAAWLLRHCKLPLHTGIGTVGQHGDPDHPFARVIRDMRKATGQPEQDEAEAEFAAGFLVPAAGNCLIFLRWPGRDRLTQDFGRDLTVTGDSPDG